MDSDYRTLHVERYGEPDSDAGGLGNARCEFNGECSREWSNECECVKDGVCRLESASSVFFSRIYPTVSEKKIEVAAHEDWRRHRENVSEMT
jgi:hypothetical protein